MADRSQIYDVTAAAAPGRDEWDSDACDDQANDNPMHIAAYRYQGALLGRWGAEPIAYVFCSFASIAARPTAAGAAASRARSLSRFFLRCRRRWISVGCRLALI